MEDQFNRDMSSAAGQGTGTAARMKEQVQEKTVQAKDAVADFGRKTVDSIDAQRAPAAGGLDQTASALHQQADKVAGVAHSAADKIQATADYVRHTDLKGMAEDVQDIVKHYPGQSLAAAAILGFLVARGLRSRD